MVRFTVTTITAYLLCFCMTYLFYTNEAFDRNVEGFLTWLFPRYVPTYAARRDGHTAGEKISISALGNGLFTAFPRASSAF